MAADPAQHPQPERTKAYKSKWKKWRKAINPNPVVVDPQPDEVTSRIKWHRGIHDLKEIAEYLIHGKRSKESRWVSSLRRLTADYLAAAHSELLLSSSECHEILDSLIKEQQTRAPLTQDVAILACVFLHDHSKTFEYLSAKNVELGHYLRRIDLASDINNLLVSTSERRLSQCLVLLTSGCLQDLLGLGGIVKALGSLGECIYFTANDVKQVLAKPGLYSHLENQVQSFLQNRQFHSLYESVSWMRSVQSISVSNEVLKALAEHFSVWTPLYYWRPNVRRIYQWEFGNVPGAQREKLFHFFDLDGPDMVLCKHESFRHAKPACFEHVRAHPPTTEMLEGLLANLHEAYNIGDGAVDLLLYIYLDSNADDATLSILDGCVATKDNACCQAIGCILKARDAPPSLDRQIENLDFALSCLKEGTMQQSKAIIKSTITDYTCTLVAKMQEIFCTQLDNGSTGEYIGMLLYELGTKIVQATWMHPSLPTELLNQLRCFPQREILEAILDHMQSVSMSHESRFKSYLSSNLGGRDSPTVGRITLETIRDEVGFWRRPPDDIRKGLARKIGKIKSLEYAVYTSCLLTMMKEPDLYVEEMTHIIQPNNIDTCHNFATYLTMRRALNQLQRNCWLLLLVSLIREQGGSYLQDMAEKMTLQSWRTYIRNVISLLRPVRSQLPESGDGITLRRLSWWETVSNNAAAVNFLLERRGKTPNFKWLYFPSTTDHIQHLFDILNPSSTIGSMDRVIIGGLAANGSNVVLISDCINAIYQTSAFGRKVCQRVLTRVEGGWSLSALEIVIKAWLSSPALNKEDYQALRHIQKIFLGRIPSNSRANAYKFICENLENQYASLLSRARVLENLRVRVQRQDSQRTVDLLKRLGVENVGTRRGLNKEVPDELVDAVEVVGESEFEMAFSLTDMTELKRQARGVPTDARMLLIRVCLRGSPAFCIHFSPTHADQGQHQYWIANQALTSHICKNPLNMMTYHISVKLGHLLKANDLLRKDPMAFIHSRIINVITKSPESCLVCDGTMNAKLWKPATCSKECSFMLRQAPLELRLHNLLIDPLCVDLLLTSVYAAAVDNSNLNLLPSCPIPAGRLRAVIDSMPPLENIQQANDLQRSIQGNDQYGRDRERLLSWLCLTFRGFMISAPTGYRIPSMPQSKQFLLVNSHHEREHEYNSQTGSQNASGVIFHGTNAARLFSILSGGLKVMHGANMINGAAHGPGIYGGNDQATSLTYAGSTGPSWINSKLKNMKIMLGCELAAYAPSNYGNIHVIPDHRRLIIRYVFLLPGNYQCPQRHHVEPAMRMAYATLRSGLLN